MELVRPAAEHLPAYRDALLRGWSPDNVRGAIAAQEQLQLMAADTPGFLALMDDPLGAAPPVQMPDGTHRARLPSLRRWMWDADGFIGSIGLRWTPDGQPLPPHVLGHIGYTVVPWRRRQGHATQALALLLPLARRQRLAAVEITTDPDNIASQRVVTANGGVLVEPFIKDAAFGATPALRYVITLA